MFFAGTVDKKTQHFHVGFLLVTSSGFKPETFRAVIWCSIQLSYGAVFAYKDMNFFAIVMFKE